MKSTSDSERASIVDECLVRVLTFNVHWTFGGGNVSALDGLLEGLPTPDVICLQEVWFPHGRPVPDVVKLGGVEYTAKFTALSHNCLLRGFVHVPPDEADSSWGLMTLSRRQILAHGEVQIGRASPPPPSSRTRRHGRPLPGDPVARFAQLTTVGMPTMPGGIVVANVHPTHRVLHAPGQLIQLRRHLRAQASPWLVAGDTNTFRWARAACRLPSTGGRIGGTFPAAWPLVQLDTVLGDPGWQIRERRLGTRLNSDHLPVFAECRRVLASADYDRPTGTGPPTVPAP